MKKLFYVIALLAIVATTSIAGAVAATSQQDKDKMSQGMMDMSAMMNEPHHQLAMAYKENMVNFAKALRQATTDTNTVNAPFARDAVAEMKRSFDQMQEHQQDHMKTMDDKMKAMDEKMKTNMAGMMKQMEAQTGAIKEDLAALDKEVQTSAPDSKRISSYVDDILKNCDSMSKMRGDMMQHKMDEPKDHKMN
jgi:hypothetical protein